MVCRAVADGVSRRPGSPGLAAQSGGTGVAGGGAAGAAPGERCQSRTELCPVGCAPWGVSLVFTLNLPLPVHD